MATAYCLDVTRLVSRQGRAPLTGVDRVERAYLCTLRSLSVPLYLLLRTRLGFILVGPDETSTIADALIGQRDWGALDLIGHLRRKASKMQRLAEAHFRRAALGRATARGLAAMLTKHLPPGTAYFNVGHAALEASVLSAWKSVTGARSVVLIHDTIPLDHPEFQRKSVIPRFEAKLRAAALHADHVVFSTQAAAMAAQPWFETFGRNPPHIIAPLGVDLVSSNETELPSELTLPSPYFMTIGTIEPRKNHALLLDIWDRFAPDDAPHLLIAGRRGWGNELVFKRLDQIARENKVITERSDLSDQALSTLLQGATGALFPSFAEGFGLPQAEAAVQGTPLICSDLAVTREILGKIPVYADPRDVYDWEKKIRNLVAVDRAAHQKPAPAFKAPTWESHFNRVLKVL